MSNDTYAHTLAPSVEKAFDWCDMTSCGHQEKSQVSTVKYQTKRRKMTHQRKNYKRLPPKSDFNAFIVKNYLNAETVRRRAYQKHLTELHKELKNNVQYSSKRDFRKYNVNSTLTQYFENDRNSISLTITEGISCNRNSESVIYM